MYNVLTVFYLLTELLQGLDFISSCRLYEEKKPVRSQSYVLLLWSEDEKFEVLDISNLKIIREWGLLSPIGVNLASPPTWLRNVVYEYLNMVNTIIFKDTSDFAY